MKLSKQVKYWKWAAWTLPFVALAGIIFSFWIGNENITAKFIVITCTVFFGISVFWWWWALDKFSSLIKQRFGMEQRFEAIMKELQNLKRDIKK